MTPTESPFSLPSEAEGVAYTGTPRVRQTRIRPEGWEPPAGATRGPSHPVWVGAFENQSPQWYAARAYGLGGSEIAAVVGLSKWESPFSLWHRKQNHLPEKDVGAPADWGTRLEGAVGRHFQERHPELRVMPSGTFRSSERPWQVANPDLLAPEAIVEVKTALYDYAWGPDGTDEVPIYYRAQVNHYMDVLGIDVAWVCVLIGGFDYREYRIPFDLADALWLREQGEAFMVSLRDGVEPAADGHFETKAAMEHLHPDIERRDVQIDPELAASYEAALKAHKAATEAKNQATARMIQAMGTARRAFCGETMYATRVPGRGEGAVPYLRANPELMSTAAAPVPLSGGSWAPAEVENNVRRALAECRTRAELTEWMTAVAHPAEELRTMANARWKELS